MDTAAFDRLKADSRVLFPILLGAAGTVPPDVGLQARAQSCPPTVPWLLCAGPWCGSGLGAGAGTVGTD